jgi:DNA-binding NarL/FixJ family response regulator
LSDSLREQLNIIRNFAHILVEHHDVLHPDEIAEAAGAMEEQAELALEALDEEPAVAEAGGGSLATARVSQGGGPTTYGLSVRELEVLRLVAQGKADKQIAGALGISTFTVNKHVGGILLKMRASSRTEAGVRAVQDGLA